MIARAHTKEEIIGVRTQSADLKNLNQVVELAVYVTDHRDGRAHVNHIALAHQLLLFLATYCLDYRLCQKLLLVKSRDALI